MSAAIMVSWDTIAAGVTALDPRATHAHGGFLNSLLLGRDLLRVPLIVISASIMALVVATGEVLLHVVGVKPTPTPPPVEVVARATEFGTREDDGPHFGAAPHLA